MTITLEEQEKILLVAEGLIKEPDSWIKGTWKCPAFKTDELGLPIKAKEGELTYGKFAYVQKTDANGRPLFQYCIEGAINQAAHDVLGRDRVRDMLGMDLEVQKHEDLMAEFMGGVIAHEIGVNHVALRLYGAHSAMHYNDQGMDDDEDSEYTDPSTHEGVLAILRERRKEVVRELELERSSA